MTILPGILRIILLRGVVLRPLTRRVQFLKALVHWSLSIIARAMSLSDLTTQEHQSNFSNIIHVVVTGINGM